MKRAPAAFETPHCRPLSNIWVILLQARVALDQLNTFDGADSAAFVYESNESRVEESSSGRPSVSVAALCVICEFGMNDLIGILDFCV